MKNLLAAFVLTAAGSAAALTYCAPDGDDANAGTTADAPKCSIQKVLGVKPSETIVLLPGTYHLSDPSQKVAGENGALHSNGSGVLRSSTGNPADVVIDGDGKSECIRIAGRFRLEGLTFTGGANPSDGARACLISVQSENCVVSNCVVRGFNRASGGKVNNIAVGLWSKAKLYDTHFTEISGDAIGVALRAWDGSLVSGCTFDGVETTAGGVEAACAVWAEKNVTVTNCTFRNGKGAKAQLRFVGAADAVCRAVDCTFTDHALEAAACYAGPYSEIQGCTFTRCTTTGNGGALFARTATVRGCTFTENKATGDGGACLVAYDDTLKTETRLHGCTFTANEAFGGAAVAVGYGYKSPDAAGNLVSRTAYGKVDIQDCLFSNNVTRATVMGDYSGGAVKFQVTSPSGGLIANSRFIGNTTSGYGGAVNARFHQDKSADAKGVVLRNCLFANNRASQQGGALYLIGQSNAQPAVTNAVENCTLVGNTASSAANGHGLYQKFGNFRCVNTLFGPSQTVVTGNNPAGNYYQACAFPANPTQTGGGDSEIRADCLVGADPKFADADAGDYSLAGGSPCVNKGVPLDWMDETAVDLAGDARVCPPTGRPDIGCFERFVASGFKLLVR